MRLGAHSNTERDLAGTSTRPKRIPTDDGRSRCATRRARENTSPCEAGLARRVIARGGIGLGTGAAVHLCNLGARVGSGVRIVGVFVERRHLCAIVVVNVHRVYRLAVARLCFGRRRIASFTRGSQPKAFLFCAVETHRTVGVRWPPRDVVTALRALRARTSALKTTRSPGRTLRPGVLSSGRPQKRRIQQTPRRQT